MLVGCSGTSRARSRFALRIVITPACEVDVVALERERLTDPHARHGEQPEQRLIARRAHRVAQPPRLLQQAADVLLGEQVGGGALATSGKDVRRRDLARRVDRLQIGGEATRDTQPLGPVVRVNADRQPCPLDRQLGGDRGRSGSVEVTDELAEQPLIFFELEPERATQPQILIDASLGDRSSLLTCRRPRCRQRPQPLDVNARVARGALQAAMPQNLTDPQQRNIRLDHVARRRVPQPV